MPTEVPWETPPPDAVAPAGAKAIPGITPASLRDGLAAVGYTCLSGKADPHILGSAYVLICDLTKGSASANVIAVYWTNEHVSTIHATVLPEPIEGEIKDASVVNDLLAPLITLPYAGSVSQQTEVWYASASTSSACKDDGCEMPIGDVTYTLQAGERGSLSLHLEGMADKP